MGPHIRFRLKVARPNTITPEIRRILCERFGDVFSAR
jgi:hypothetical protein